MTAAEDAVPDPAEDRLAAGETVRVAVESRAHGWRLDHYLTRLFPNYSRSVLQKAVSGGKVLVNGLPVKPSRRLRVDDRLSVELPQEADRGLPPENIPLDILHEDDELIVINKPAGLIVHPGKGNYGGTLAAGLQHHFDQLSDMAGRHRPGIVHRLDRDTSGVLVVAKDNRVHDRLSRQFADRTVEKEYRALCWGQLSFDSDYIETHLRVSRRNRERMVVCGPGGQAREAVTFYEVLERFSGFTWVRLKPRTGRTHQLRAHMEHLGHSIVADRLYGGRRRLTTSDVLATLDNEPAGGIPSVDCDVLITRQALHALRLSFTHPRSGKRVEFQAPLAHDIQTTLETLQAAEDAT